MHQVAHRHILLLLLLSLLLLLFQLLPHDGGVGLVLDGRAEQLQLRRVSAVKLPDVSNRTRIFAR
jgi:hypothetical protein